MNVCFSCTLFLCELATLLHTHMNRKHMHAYNVKYPTKEIKELKFLDQ